MDNSFTSNKILIYEWMAGLYATESIQGYKDTTESSHVIILHLLLNNYQYDYNKIRF